MKYVGPENKYPVGDINFTVGEMALQTKNENSGEYENFSMTGIKLTGTSSENQGNPQQHPQSRFRGNRAGGGKYGPGGYELAIQEHRYGFVDENPGSSSRRIRIRAQTEEAESRFMTELMKIVPGLIKKSPEIELTKLNPSKPPTGASTAT